MQKKIAIVFLGVIIFSLGCSTYEAGKLSIAIEKKQNSKHGLFKRFGLSNNSREKALKQLEVKPTDTLYFLETYDLEQAKIFGKIWNRHQTVNYHSDRKEVIITNQDVYFSPIMKELVGKWDTVGIRKEEKLYSNLNHGDPITAYRMILGKKTPTVESIRFKEFLKFGRNTTP